ncbi:MAG: cytoplasmic protein, partial [Clostridiales bacterium]|nr:cytoplasmic protein [Clostridiales bacterium]
MKELVCSGLPIWLDVKEMRLEFRDGLACRSSGGKGAVEMRGLLMNEDGVDGSVHCYDFYRDVAFEGDRELLQKYGYRYDITAIAPGTINGEYIKNSGHYHGYIEGKGQPYPEIYEVIHGELFFIMQKSKNFDNPDEEPVIESAKAVRVTAGQAIVVPPFYAHCAVNIG